MRVWLAIVFAVVGMALTGVAETPLLRFGIASDVHILRDWSDPFTPGLTNQALHLEKALRWFDAEGAEAVQFAVRPFNFYQRLGKAILSVPVTL